MVAFVVVGALAPATGGASAAGWLAPVNLSLAANDLGIDERGNALAVGIGAGSGGQAMVRAVSRPLGGQWSGSVAVSGSGDSHVGAPQLAVNPRGDAVAVWSAADAPGADQTVRVATRLVGGTWTAPFELGDDAVYQHDYEVAIDAQGNATASWVEFSGSAFVVRAASRPRVGKWSAAVNVTNSSDGNARSLRLAVDPRGNVTAVWLGDAPDPDGPGVVKVVRSKWRTAAGAWSSPADDLSDSGGAQAPQVAVDPQGNATAIWERSDSGSTTVQSARRAAGGGWGPADDVAEGSSPQVAVDPMGNATAVWLSSALSGPVVRTGRRPAAGAWSGPVDLAVSSAAGNVTSPWVAIDPQGNTTAIWGRFSGVQATAQASRREVGASDWGGAVDLAVGPISQVPAAGVDPQGHVTVAWTASPSLGPWSGSSSVFDAVTPELRDPAVPVRGQVGQPVAMSVDPFDAWSAVTTSWEFGDGASASGATANHTYGAPGEHTVTITGVDGAGNTTRTARKITIDPVPIVDYGDPGRVPDPGPPGPKSIVTAPVVSGLQQSHSSWRTQRSARRPRLAVGTSFRFRLDRAASVRLAFSQIAAGRRVNANCVKQTTANRRKRRCDRYLARGTVNLAGKAGANAYAFRGKLGGRSLKPGRYRVEVTAQADGKTSAPTSVRFTIAG